MTTIAYDRHVTDYIAELSRTNHVTHTSYKKTSVTFHHNAGNLSHAQVLNVWKTRPASAHFDVDAEGNVAQYVKVTEYAWSVGDGEGNRSSISIEQANSSGAPDWEVSEITWQSAARLAGWLFAKVIKAKPTKSNVFFHHHWSSTACAGPYMDKIYTKLLKAVQESYEHFTNGDGKDAPAPVNHHKTTAEIAAEVRAGKWGNGDDRIKRLSAAGYNPKVIQTEVNRQVNGGKAVNTKKSITTIAHEVIAGKWGNGQDRVVRLSRAGYNAVVVQREVNRLV